MFFLVLNCNEMKLFYFVVLTTQQPQLKRPSEWSRIYLYRWLPQENFMCSKLLGSGVRSSLQGKSVER